MTRIATMIVCTVTCAALAAGAPEKFAILPEQEAKAAVSQCSRSAPKIEGTWPMTANDAAQLERDLPQLRSMKSKYGRQIGEIDSYLRQYVGVVVGGKRYVYINAFAADVLDYWPKIAAVPQWKKKAFGGCDGGNAFWGALYDPATRKFSELAINGP